MNIINTKYFQEGSTVIVTIFSSNINRADRKISELFAGQCFESTLRSKDDLKFKFVKDGVNFEIRYAPISESSRGRRTVYAIVDIVDLYSNDKIYEMIAKIIKPTTITYDHIIKEKYRNTVANNNLIII